MIDYPNKLEKIFDKLELFQIKPIIVGGYIRDILIKTHINQEKKSPNLTYSKDIDIELYGISSLDLLCELLLEFGNVNSVGKSFGVCKLTFEDLDLDFSLPREDNKVSSGHKGFSVQTSSTINFKEAAFRRDFTINAIGYDVKNKILLDPYNGIKDLKKRTLNAVDKNTFEEDPLRVLRAVQFASRFNFNLSDDTFLLCKDMIKRGTLEELSKERIFDEIKKLLLKSDSPSSGFKLLKNLGALEYFDELKTLNETDWNFILLALDNMSRKKTEDSKTNIVLMLAITCYKMSEKQILSFINRLTTNKEILSRVLALIHNKLKTEMSNTELYRLAQYVNIEDMIIFYSTLFEQNEKIYAVIMTRAKLLGVLNARLEAYLQGRDLVKRGLTPSIEFSKILTLAYEAQMREEFSNYQEALVWLDKKLLS